MVGGAGEQYLLRVVAQHADWWNYVFSSLEEYRQKQTALKRHCQAVGRDYNTIIQVVHVGVLVAENERAVQRLRQSRDVRPLENGVVGMPEQVATTLRGIMHQGANRLTVHLADAPRPDGTLLFGMEVIPQLGM
jgi:alkanesulfonate monooxygenase SsuD/methylene tetrahydromethanopterin reductase-like flavin-dependent oxidoreductase (luciferase family)